MPLAESAVDLSTATGALLGAAGPTGVVVYLVVRFLQHIADADKKNRESHAALVTRVECIASDFKAGQAQIVSDFRDEHRQTVTQLISVNREAVSAMGAVSDRVGDLGRGVGELRTEVHTLGETVGALGTTVHTLTDRVDRIDGAEPPKRGKPNAG
jgi:uncharacterized membrane-anchored protein